MKFGQPVFGTKNLCWSSWKTTRSLYISQEFKLKIRKIEEFDNPEWDFREVWRTENTKQFFLLSLGNLLHILMYAYKQFKHNQWIIALGSYWIYSKVSLWFPYLMGWTSSNLSNLKSFLWNDIFYQWYLTSLCFVLSWNMGSLLIWIPL